uniref:Transposase Tc1-like domain-containing protein n=1 Tax=Micrurus spixii TaxID=129469 RepID=A0A2D4MUC6_9SAUR
MQSLPRKLNAANKRHIILTSLQHQISSSAISTELAEISRTQVHPSTVWRSLARNHVHGRIVAQKPYFLCVNKAKQLNYIQKHRNWDAEKFKWGWRFGQDQQCPQC